MPKYRTLSKKIRDLPQLKAAYLAGLVDGDGSISRTQTSPGNHQWRVSVYNHDEKIMKWLTRNIGGTVYYHPCHETSRGLCKNGNSWVVYSQLDVHSLLLSMLPFLVIKSRQARTALKYLSPRVAGRMLLAA